MNSIYGSGKILKKLRELDEDDGLTADDLSQVTGIAPGDVSSWLRRRGREDGDVYFGRDNLWHARPVASAAPAPAPAPKPRGSSPREAVRRRIIATLSDSVPRPMTRIYADGFAGGRVTKRTVAEEVARLSASGRIGCSKDHHPMLYFTGTPDLPPPNPSQRDADAATLARLVEETGVATIEDAYRAGMTKSRWTRARTAVVNAGLAEAIDQGRHMGIKLIRVGARNLAGLAVACAVVWGGLAALFLEVTP